MKVFVFCFLLFSSGLLQARALPRETPLKQLNTLDNIFGYLFQFTVDKVYFDTHLIRPQGSSTFYQNGVCIMGLDKRESAKNQGESPYEIKKEVRFKVNYVLLVHYKGRYQNNIYLNNPSWKVTLILESTRSPITNLFLECLLPKNSVSSLDQITIDKLIHYSELPMVFLD